MRVVQSRPPSYRQTALAGNRRSGGIGEEQHAGSPCSESTGTGGNGGGALWSPGHQPVAGVREPWKSTSPVGPPVSAAEM